MSLEAYTACAAARGCTKQYGPIPQTDGWGYPTGETHEYCSMQIDLHDDVAAKLIRFAHSLPGDILHDKGIENESHVTVKYGLPPLSTDELEKVLENVKEIEMSFGSVSMFAVKDKYDVLKVDVASPALRALNAKVRTSFPTVDLQDSYRPHVTIAYLLPGRGAAYLGKSVLGGDSYRAESVAYCDYSGNRSVFKLAGPQASNDTEEELEPLTTQQMMSLMGVKISDFNFGPRKPEPKAKPMAWTAHNSGEHQAEGENHHYTVRPRQGTGALKDSTIYSVHAKPKNRSTHKEMNAGTNRPFFSLREAKEHAHEHNHNYSSKAMSASGGILKTGKRKKKHKGFKEVQGEVERKEGVSKKAAGAIVANAARHASKAAKVANPCLKKVKMSGEGPHADSPNGLENYHHARIADIKARHGASGGKTIGYGGTLAKGGIAAIWKHPLGSSATPKQTQAFHADMGSHHRAASAMHFGGSYAPGKSRADQAGHSKMHRLHEKAAKYHEKKAGTGGDIFLSAKMSTPITHSKEYLADYHQRSVDALKGTSDISKSGTPWHHADAAHGYLRRAKTTQMGGDEKKRFHQLAARYHKKAAYEHRKKNTDQHVGAAIRHEDAAEAHKSAM